MLPGVPKNCVMFIIFDRTWQHFLGHPIQPILRPVQPLVYGYYLSPGFRKPQAKIKVFDKAVAIQVMYQVRLSYG